MRAALLLLFLGSCTYTGAEPVYAPPPAATATSRPYPGGDARGPSTPNERADAVQTARRLESAPLSQGAAEERARLTVWIMQVPDIVVNTCPKLLESVEEGSARAVVIGQMLIGSAVVIIEHPE